MKQNILDPYFKEHPEQKDNKPGYERILNFENMFDQKYFTNCFLESLRIDPPVTFSSMACLTQDTMIGKYKIKGGEQFEVDMYQLHRNPKEWIDPDQYIPDRFDPSSKYFLTPDGKKRHPMSFTPFLGGKRICLGKTFVESISKITGPTILHNFDFEFTDKEHFKKKPENNVICLREPVVIVKIKKSQESW